MKLYYGDECFYLFKRMYYTYCNYSIKKLEKEIEKLYPNMVYANDYIGVQVKTISRLICMKNEYKNVTNNKYWFEVFIKGDILHEEILNRNGVY